MLIPKAVYEDLRDRMTSRVEATINYAYSDTGCRERMLLSYFGENKADPPMSSRASSTWPVCVPVAWKNS